MCVIFQLVYVHVCFQPAEVDLCAFFFFVSLQLDLEPEGKVYIHISLSGSFIDGKAAARKAAMSRLHTDR